MLKKGQSSLEFLMIFGIGFGIILILSGLFFSYFSEEKSSLDIKHIENIGEKIISTSEKIYFMGKDNKLTIDARFPENIQNISIIHYTKDISGTPTEFDVLNITFHRDGETYYDSTYFQTNELYIRFNCTRCNHIPSENLSYYNESMFSEGNKKIEIRSMGDWVSIDFQQ